MARAKAAAVAPIQERKKDRRRRAAASPGAEARSRRRAVGAAAAARGTARLLRGRRGLRRPSCRPPDLLAALQASSGESSSSGLADEVLSDAPGVSELKG
ncbi:unnamed protein product [Prorocentrum cordatum]|uniref:Uncharacterized protein n=1 Tax=Prorocentrum cordatum TaxID=2364126 RepID=A0ABN9TAV1_9DINO|nr:unnamed protein product [Polarella glacialis]